MDTPRTIAVVTTGRADHGLLIPVVDAIGSRPGCEPFWVLTGAHLHESPGRPAAPFDAATARIGARVPIPAGDDADAGMADAIGRGVLGFAGAFRETRPDVVLVLGDRFETLAAAVAAFASGIPVAHLHGGEISLGAADNQFRYAITALASLHLVATELSRRRLVAMGEPPARVVRVGAPGLDPLIDFRPPPRAEFARAVGLTPSGPFLLVTLHPCTLDAADPAEQARDLLTALDGAAMPCLVTAANQDPGGHAINAVLRPACRDRGWPFAEALGPGLYHAAMSHASAMVGNSSSGIIEAATLGLPVVNIGDRQAGRERSGNVVDCAHDPGSIARALHAALELGRRAYDNVYGDGRASPRIAQALAELPLGVDAMRKPFTPPGL